MTRVRWEDLEPGQYEDMVSILLCCMYPDAAERIDGSGGDGGRDVQLRYGADRDGFELKSFTGRLSGTRRTQVKNSLRRASSLGLRSWTLVVPIDWTPPEKEWFDSLQSLIDCPIDWRGLTWLEARMAERPFITRYFIDRKEDEVVALLKEMSLENAALVNGVPDAMARVQTLVGRANELDPYYRFAITSDGETSSVTVIPRYPMAVRDRPIGFKTTFRFPKTAEGQGVLAAFNEALQFGTAVTLTDDFIERLEVDMPGGLGQDWTGGKIEILPNVPPDPERRMALAAKGASGTQVARVPLELTILSQGQGGAILEGKDRADLVRVAMRIDSVAKHINLQLTFRGSQPFYPNDMVPIVRMLAAIREGASLVLLDEAGSQIGVLEGALDDAGELAGEEFTELVEDFAILQAKAGQLELVKPELTFADVHNIRIGARWARGEAVEGTWRKVSMHLAEELGAVASDGSFPIRIQEPSPVRVEIQGIEYRIGTITIATFPSARLSDLCRRRWRKRPPPRGSHVTLIPAETDRYEMNAR